MENIDRFINSNIRWQLIKMLAEEGYRVFSSEEAQLVTDLLGIKTSIKHLLLYLKREGWIVSIRKGLYALGPPFWGPVPLHRFEVACGLVKKGVISHGSALEHYGFLKGEALQTVYMSVRKKTTVPRKEEGAFFSFQGKTYRFIQMREALWMGHTAFKIGNTTIPITDPERSLLDGVMHPHYCGGMETVVEAVKGALPSIDIQKLFSYSLNFPVAVAKRLGWVLEKAGVRHPRIVSLHRLPMRNTVLLDPLGKKEGKQRKYWKVIENVE